jgi:antitoxin MazE
MLTHIQKWGNSLGLRIPKSLAEDIHVEDGAAVDLRVEEGSLIIAPVGKPTYTLESLVSKITPENRHELVDFGSARGREVW